MSVETISTADRAESFALLCQSPEFAPGLYPDFSQDKGVAQAYHAGFLDSPLLIGKIARADGRAVGQILGIQAERPFGFPRRFAFIWNCWVDPEFRRQGLMAKLFAAWSASCQAKGLDHWEASARDELSELLVSHGPGVRRLSVRIGGDLPRMEA